MSISINTSEYIKIKKVIIDGEEFEFTPLTTAQSLAVTEIQNRLQKSSNDVDAVNKLADIFMSAFKPTDKAKKILEGLPIESLGKIFRKVSESDDDEN